MVKTPVIVTTLSDPPPHCNVPPEVIFTDLVVTLIITVTVLELHITTESPAPGVDPADEPAQLKVDQVLLELQFPEERE